MKRFSLIAAMTLLCMSSFAQLTIRGIVKDADEMTALPGATVSLENSFTGTHTNAQGIFGLSGLAPGSYSLQVSFMGYTRYVQEIDLKANVVLEVLLQRSATMTQEVVVNAMRADSRTPLTYSNVSKEQIQERNLGQDLPYLISLTPSVIVSSDAGAGVGYTWMNIRGSDYTRINVTLNGIPVNDAESHGVWWVNMPDIASSTDNIQIQRGVGTSTQGTASFGATISLNSTNVEDQTYAEVFSSGGSFNTLRNTVSFGTGLIDGHWAFDGRLSRISSDGFIDRASSDLKSYYVSGGYYGKRTVVKALTFGGSEKTYQAWNGVPGDSLKTNRTFNPSGMHKDQQGNIVFYDDETDNYQQDHYQLHVTHELSPTWVGNVSLHYTYGRGYYEQYRENDRFSRYNLPNVVIENTVISRSDLIRRRWLDNHFYGVTYGLNYNSFDRLTAIFGGGYNIYDGDHFGEIIWARMAPNANIRHRYYDNNGTKKDFNVFAKINYELASGLHWFVDIQNRRIVYDFVGLGMVNNQIVPLEQRARFNFWNPKTGLIYDLNSNHQLYAFAGIGNREPVRKDFTESSPGSRPKHETMRNYELGYRYAQPTVMAGVNFYLMDYDNQLILTGMINDVGGFTRQNIKDSYRMGVELEGAYRMNSKLEWGGNLTLSRNIIPEFTEYNTAYDNNWNMIGVEQYTYKNTTIAFSPSVVAASMLMYRPLEAVGLALHSKYVGKQHIDNTRNASRMLDAYFVNDLKFSYTLKNGLFRELEFSLMINNVLDVNYITNAWVEKGVLGDRGLISLYDGYFPQAGRHFLGGVRLRL